MVGITVTAARRRTLSLADCAADLTSALLDPQKRAQVDIGSRQGRRFGNLDPRNQPRNQSIEMSLNQFQGKSKQEDNVRRRNCHTAASCWRRRRSSVLGLASSTHPAQNEKPTRLTVKIERWKGMPSA